MHLNAGWIFRSLIKTRNRNDRGDLHVNAWRDTDDMKSEQANANANADCRLQIADCGLRIADAEG